MEMKATWTVIRSELRGFRGDLRGVNFEIRSEAGDLYATVSNQADAEVIAFGLNNDFLQHSCGGFANNVVAEIRRAMTGEAPAEWAIES